MENNEQTEQQPLKMSVNDFRFGFVLDFDEQPTAQTLCDAVIMMFQQGSVATISDKDELLKAVEQGKEQSLKRFAFGGVMGPDGMQISIGVVKPRSNIIQPKNGNWKGRLQ